MTQSDGAVIVLSYMSNHMCSNNVFIGELLFTNVTSDLFDAFVNTVDHALLSWMV